jgi:hypothetical protein
VRGERKLRIIGDPSRRGKRSRALAIIGRTAMRHARIPPFAVARPAC